MQISRLLDLRWDDYLDTISRNRGLGESELKGLLDQKFLLSPEVCKQVGLVDEVSSYGEMLDRLKTLGKEDRDTEEFARVELIDYVDRPLSSSNIEGEEEKNGAQIAVVYVEGSIIDGMGDDGISVGGKEIAKRIREVSNDDNFKGLVLRVNSPGGSVSGSDAILSEITRIKEKGIPVIVSMGAVAASGGYWISMDSDKIFAGEQTITGSIGVFGLIPNLKKMAEGFGIHWDVVKTHASSDIMSVSRAKSDLELEVVQNHVERIYDRFLNLVSENRDLNMTRIREIAQGRVWMGVDAHELGLVDELGGLEDAIKFAAQTAGVTEYKVTEFPKVKNSLDLLADALQVKYNNQRGARVPTSLEIILKETKFFINQVRHFNDPRNSYSLLPWYQGRFGF
jgi:protease-4